MNSTQNWYKLRKNGDIMPRDLNLIEKLITQSRIQKDQKLIEKLITKSSIQKDQKLNEKLIMKSRIEKGL